MKRLGKHQKKMLSFLQSCGGLHTLAKDRETQDAAKRLVKRGLIVINEFGQAYWKPNYDINNI